MEVLAPPRPADGARREARRRGDRRLRGVRGPLQRPAAEGQLAQAPGRRRAGPADAPRPARPTPAGLIRRRAPSNDPGRRRGRRSRPMTTRRTRRPRRRLRAHLDEHADARWSPTRSSSGSPASRRCRSTPATCRRPPSGSRPSCAVGIDDVEVVRDGRPPDRDADWLHAAGAPTVLVYCHYDVQPVDPLDLWNTPPFEPFDHGRPDARPGRGRRQGPDPCTSAREALLATRGGLPVNLKFLFEGEEEFGSASLYTWLTANRERLAADVAVISDTGFFEGNLPAITIGLRGIMYAQIDVVGTPVDLHSGGYGGVVENPANALAQIIAALKGPDGRIRIPGFYDDVVAAEPTPIGRAIAALPFDEEEYRATIGRARPRRRSRLLRAGAARRPADARRQRHLGRLPGRGRQDDHPRPRAREGELPAGRRPGSGPDLRALPRLRGGDRAARRHGPTVQDLHGGHPSLTPIDHPATRAAARALEATFGGEPLYSREGGSIPVCAASSRCSACRSSSLGFSQPDETRMPRTSGWTSTTRGGHPDRSSGCGTSSPGSVATRPSRSGRRSSWCGTFGPCPATFGRLSRRKAVLRCTPTAS